MASVVETHDRVKQVEWTPTYVTPEPHFPTKYKMPKKTKDPFRTLVREYLTMEQEKDDRQYGGFEDVLARTASVKDAQPGWLEGLKLGLPIVVYAEYGAEKCQSMLTDTIENAELRQGYLAQAMDERRHLNQQMYLLRYMAKNAQYSAGFDRGMKVRGNNLFARAGRACFDNFYLNDPIESAIALQVVGETAYTNPLFVALTQVAARNDDHATPGVFLSIQSDEARHMANGYSTLAAVLSEPDNLPMLQQDFDRAFWTTHCFLDPLLSALFDYFGGGRMDRCYYKLWEEWVADDWVGNYIGTLEPFGLQVPKYFGEAAERLKWAGHTAAMVAAASWPLHYWRFPPMTEKHMEWMEAQYPGWDALYGDFWRNYSLLGDPKHGIVPLQAMPDRPHLCRTCSLPCVFPRLDTNTARAVRYNGKNHAFCTDACEAIFCERPERYLVVDLWDEIFDGMGLEEFIVSNDLLRADGHTLIAQPHLSEDNQWTLDDIRRLNFEITDPLKNLTGLPELVRRADGTLARAAVAA
jgi:YHS domain-containing protein